MRQFRDEWLDGVRALMRVSMPPKVTQKTTVIAIARAWMDRGNDDGTRIRAGGDSMAVDTGFGRATVLRVRRWLIAEGFGRVDSGSVMGKKAVWWHAEIPGRSCSTCSSSDPFEGSLVPDALAIPLKDRYSSSPSVADSGDSMTTGPTTDPSTDPSGGTATRDPEEQPSKEGEVMGMGDFERGRPRSIPLSDEPCEYEGCTVQLNIEHVAAGITIHEACARARDGFSAFDQSA